MLYECWERKQIFNVLITILVKKKKKKKKKLLQQPTSPVVHVY